MIFDVTDFEFDLMKPWAVAQHAAPALVALFAKSQDLKNSLLDITSQPKHKTQIIDNFYQLAWWKDINYKEAPKNSIALINISGFTINRSSYFYSNYTDIATHIQEANNSKNIIGIVLSIDSPGGQAQGLEELAAIIKASPKPVYSLVNNAYSAAYHIAAASHKIFATSKTSGIGSIGTMATIMLTDEMYKKYGIEVHDVYSSYSDLKNSTFKNFKETKDSSEYQKKYLDPVALQFINHVKSSRTIEDDDQVFKGQDYYAQSAPAGMIDGYKNLIQTAEAIQQKVKFNIDI